MISPAFSGACQHASFIHVVKTLYITYLYTRSDTPTYTVMCHILLLQHNGAIVVTTRAKQLCSVSIQNNKLSYAVWFGRNWELSLCIMVVNYPLRG